MQIWYESDENLLLNVNNDASTAAPAQSISGIDPSVTTNANSSTNGKSASILYHQLVAMADNKNDEFKQELMHKINLITNDDESKQAWNEMIKHNGKDCCKQKTTLDQLRQDSTKCGMKYPNTLGYQLNVLEKYKQKDFYDANVYLSKLMITANILNDIFHCAMENIFCNDKFATYTKGPLKKMNRCQAKAEKDYAFRKFPHTACVLDIIRCSIVYPTCESLINGIKLLENAILKGNTPLKKILRIKNMFSCDYNFEYADIKFNILVEDNVSGHSMIAEAQILLKCMIDHKKKIHRIYEITRNEDFINDMSNVFEISKNKKEQLYYLIQSENTVENIELLTQFLLTYSNSNDFPDLNDIDNKTSNLTAWDHVIKSASLEKYKLLLNYGKPNNVSLMKLIAAGGSDKKVYKLLNLVMQRDDVFTINTSNDKSGYNPLVSCIVYGDNCHESDRLFTILLGKTKNKGGERVFDINHATNYGWTPIFYAIYHLDLNKFDMLLEEMDTNVHFVATNDKNYTPLLLCAYYAYYAKRVEFIQHMVLKNRIEMNLNQEKIDISKQVTSGGENALELVAKWSLYDELKYLLTLQQFKDYMKQHDSSNKVLKECAESTYSFDENNQREYINFKCFKVLLESMIANNCDKPQQSIIDSCKAKRPQYFDELIRTWPSINDNDQMVNIE